MKNQQLQQPICPIRHVFLLRESPLVLYIFTSETEVQNLFINGTQSGGLCVNDTIMHYAGKRERRCQWMRSVACFSTVTASPKSLQTESEPVMTALPLFVNFVCLLSGDGDSNYSCTVSTLL